ncbi:facilitated trehalose transporter Tret1 [Parasteatoda tepidariorum]|nr:facilitated trehalose transporter Tret1 [Parasteatoda tepidariorum]
MTSPEPKKLQPVSVECDAIQTSEIVVTSWKIYVACVASYLYILSMGMTISYTAPASMDMRRPGSRMQHITDDEITWIGSLSMLGGVPANILGGYFSQKYGRKTVLMLTSILFTSSWLMIAYASSVAWICAGRIISGFCTGLYVVAVPAYVAEIAPQNKRGMLSSGLPLFNTLGIFLVMCLGLVLRWSWLAISIVILTVCSACMMVFMPESPVWLVRESRLEEAAHGLKFFRGKHFPYKKEVQQIAETLRNEQQNVPITLQDLKNPTFYKPLSISVALMFFWTASGSGPILAYTVEIFQRLGSALDPNVAAIILSAIQIVAAVSCSLIIDKYGRRKLYIMSASATSIMLICLGAYSFAMKHQPVTQGAIGYIPLVCFAIYAFVFNIGMGPIPFVMIPEMVSVQFRSTVLAISTVVISFFAFSSNKSYDGLRSLVGDHGVYWTYGFLSLCSVPFGYFILPETKNKSFEDISKSFSKKRDCQMTDLTTVK